jgi:hypothetical protein
MHTTVLSTETCHLLIARGLKSCALSCKVVLLGR